MSVPSDGWFRANVAVRFRDLDPMGHAHHTLPLIYVEEARAQFWRLLTGRASLDDIDYVLAEVTARFHARVHYPSMAAVGLAVRRVGEKSFTTAFEVRSESGELLTSGSTVQVAYDYAANRSKPIEPALRAVLEEWLASAQKSNAIPAEAAPIRPPRT